MMIMMIIIPSTFVTKENADMHFGYELYNGNGSTALEEYQ